MRNLKPLIVLGSLFLIAAMAIGDLNAEPRFKRHRGPLAGVELFAEELQLSQEQREAIKSQRFAVEKQAVELRSKIQLGELELRQMLTSDGADENRIIGKIKEIGELKTNMRIARVQNELAIKKILTHEQLQKLETMKREHLKKRLEGRWPMRQFERQELKGYQDDFDLEELMIEDTMMEEEGSEI